MSSVEELLSKLLHPVHLLFVKSDRRQAEVLQRQIQQNYECVTDWVASGAEALRCLAQSSYDLLLLESTPQDMSAAAILRQVKSAAPALPVVLIFERPSESIAQEVAAVGVVCTLIEPLKQSDIDDLFRVFKIRVRSRENSSYLESRRNSFCTPVSA